MADASWARSAGVSLPSTSASTAWRRNGSASFSASFSSASRPSLRDVRASATSCATRPRASLPLGRNTSASWRSARRSSRGGNCAITAPSVPPSTISAAEAGAGSRSPSWWPRATQPSPIRLPMRVVRSTEPAIGPASRALYSRDSPRRTDRRDPGRKTVDADRGVRAHPAVGDGGRVRHDALHRSRGLAALREPRALPRGRGDRLHRAQRLVPRLRGAARLARAVARLHGAPAGRGTRHDRLRRRTARRGGRDREHDRRQREARARAPRRHRHQPAQRVAARALGHERARRARHRRAADRLHRLLPRRAGGRRPLAASLAAMSGSVRSLAILACALALAGAAAADELADARHARALAEELMSPFCPGHTLSDCPSPNAAAVRETIRAWVGEGRSDEEIRTRLKSQYGDVLDGEPQSGWGRAAPLAVIALVGVAFAFGLRRVIARPGSGS